MKKFTINSVATRISKAREQKPSGRPTTNA